MCAQGLGFCSSQFLIEVALRFDRKHKINSRELVRQGRWFPAPAAHPEAAASCRSCAEPDSQDSFLNSNNTLVPSFSSSTGDVVSL